MSACRVCDRQRVNIYEHEARLKRAARLRARSTNPTHYARLDAQIAAAKVALANDRAVMGGHILDAHVQVAS